jgi:hypothetical protein
MFAVEHDIDVGHIDSGVCAGAEFILAGRQISRLVAYVVQRSCAESAETTG